MASIDYSIIVENSIARLRKINGSKHDDVYNRSWGTPPWQLLSIYPFRFVYNIMTSSTYLLSQVLSIVAPISRLFKIRNFTREGLAGAWYFLVIAVVN